MSCRNASVRLRLVLPSAAGDCLASPCRGLPLHSGRCNVARAAASVNPQKGTARLTYRLRGAWLAARRRCKCAKDPAHRGSRAFSHGNGAAAEPHCADDFDDFLRSVQPPSCVGKGVDNVVGSIFSCCDCPAMQMLSFKQDCSRATVQPFEPWRVRRHAWHDPSNATSADDRDQLRKALAVWFASGFNVRPVLAPCCTDEVGCSGAFGQVHKLVHSQTPLQLVDRADCSCVSRFAATATGCCGKEVLASAAGLPDGRAHPTAPLRSALMMKLGCAMIRPRPHSCPPPQTLDLPAGAQGPRFAIGASKACTGQSRPV